MAETVRVNFAQPIPIFPFRDLVLLPHETQPLHIFERRYRQMIGHCLDRSGQFAIATVDTDQHAEAGPDDPVPLRPAACVGQIIQHERMLEGQYLLRVHGVCRARIEQVLEPSGERLYRTAVMQPIDVGPPDTPELDVYRERIRALVAHRPMDHLEAIEALREWTENDADVPTRALLELLACLLVREPERKYRLLEEADACCRAEMVCGELEHIESLIARATGQSYRDWPKGLSWN